MKEWKIVARDGNPEKAGAYDVILIHDEVKYNGPNPSFGHYENHWEKTGRRFAVRDSRWFGMAQADDGWIMKDQPKEGLVWHVESGSYIGERVYAWLPGREYPEIELPEGVEWEKEE